MGRCTRRSCWVDGTARRVGYLSELRLDATARGRFRILRDGYQFFRTLQQDAPAHLYFTSIAADNHRARSLLEKGARGLPAYAFLAELDTLLVAIPRRPGAAKLRVESATLEHVPEIVRVLNDPGAAPPTCRSMDCGNLARSCTQVLPLDRFFVVPDGRKIVACGALWDQRDFRQTVIHSYSPSSLPFGHW